MKAKFIHAFFPAISRVTHPHQKTVTIPARVSIAWIPVSDTEIEVGMSWCHPEDNFARREARNRAQGKLVANRLHNEPRLTVKGFHTNKDGKQSMSVEGVLAAVNENIMSLPRSPRWALGFLEGAPLKFEGGTP